MDISKIKAILDKADPARNSNYQERHVALTMAHREMDKQGLSYASLGYSQTDAERIENQFSVTSGHSGNAGSSRTGYRWWNPFSWWSPEPEEHEADNNDYGRSHERRWSWEWEQSVEPAVDWKEVFNQQAADWLKDYGDCPFGPGDLQDGGGYGDVR